MDLKTYYNEIDTTREYFYYNSENRLTEKWLTWYAHQSHGSCIPDGYPSWGDTIITFYHYDMSGNKVLETFGFRESNDPRNKKSRDIEKQFYAENPQLRETFIPEKRFIYDKQNRLTIYIDATASNYYEKSIYSYFKDGYRKVTYYNREETNADTTTVRYTYDHSKNIVQETEYDGDIRKELYYDYAPKKLLKLEKLYIREELRETKTYTYQ